MFLRNKEIGYKRLYIKIYMYSHSVGVSKAHLSWKQGFITRSNYFLNLNLNHHFQMFYFFILTSSFYRFIDLGALICYGFLILGLVLYYRNEANVYLAFFCLANGILAGLDAFPITRKGEPCRWIGFLST